MTIGTNPIISFPTDDHPSPGQTASHGAGRASSLPSSSLLYILSSGSLNWNYVHYHRDIRISERAETKASGFEVCGAQVEEYQCFLSCTSRAAKTCHLQCPTTANLQIQTVQTCRTGEYELAANAHTTKTHSLSISSPLCGWLSHLVPTTVHYKLNFWGKQAISALAPLHYSEVLDSIPSQCRRHKHFSKRLNSSSR